MKKILFFLIPFLVTSTIIISAQQTGNPEKGKALYAICVTCHGQQGEGNKDLNSPRLTGQHDWYLIRQLKNFKEGIRGTNPKDLFGMQMRPMALTLADDQMILDVVAYINTLKLPDSAVTAETVPGNPEKGKAAYVICTTCHQQNGEGNKALNAPRLSGLQGWYLTQQLKNFKEGIRGSNPKDLFGMQMKPMALTLPDDQAIQDVVAHIKTLK